MSEPTMTVSLRVNGEQTEVRVPPRRSLVDCLRHDLGLTGSHVGCEHGVCGACTVRLDGRIVRGCLLFAVQAEGAEVETIEGLESDPDMHALQEAFMRHNALQCGFCTPGMLLTALELIQSGRLCDREGIRIHISGNYCRCTGYQSIVTAIEEVLSTWRAE
jgi:aerobic carbon-monoxide dehydrogenase small subunit